MLTKSSTRNYSLTVRTDNLDREYSIQKPNCQLGFYHCLASRNTYKATKDLVNTMIDYRLKLIQDLQKDIIKLNKLLK